MWRTGKFIDWWLPGLLGKDQEVNGNGYKCLIGMEKGFWSWILTLRAHPQENTPTHQTEHFPAGDLCQVEHTSISI